MEDKRSKNLMIWKAFMGSHDALPKDYFSVVRQKLPKWNIANFLAKHPNLSALILLYDRNLSDVLIIDDGSISTK